jgi:hypothetical protein
MVLIAIDHARFPVRFFWSYWCSEIARVKIGHCSGSLFSIDIRTPLLPSSNKATPESIEKERHVN